MTNLTSTQMLVLTSAYEHGDGIATRPDTLNRSAAVKVAAKLLDLGLVQERRAKPGWPIWRTDVSGKAGMALSLKILMPGRAVVKAATSGVRAAPAAAATVNADVLIAAVTGSDAKKPAARDRPKIGSKRILILAMMQRESGATLVDLASATGWLPHSTRAALTALRKSGVAIVRSRDEQAASSVYRIELPAAATAA